MVILYFAAEHSCIHRTRRRENIYIITVLSLIQFFGFVEFHWRATVFSEQSSLFMLDSCRHVTSIMLFMYLIQVHAAYTPLERFSATGNSKYDKKNLCQSHMGPVGSHYGRSHIEGDNNNFHAIRVTEEIESLTEEVLKNFRSGFFGDKFTASLVELLYCVSLISEFAWAVNGGTYIIQRSLLVMELLVFAYTWYVTLKRLCVTCFKSVKNLDKVIVQLIESNDEYLIEHVLLTICVPDLLEAVSIESLCTLTDGTLEKDLLTMWSKCVLLDGLQKRGLKQMLFAQKAADILLSCKTHELTLVKNSIDEGGDWHNLYKLVYVDIKDSAIRWTILNHLKQEAKKLRRAKGKAEGIKILSDIDDTLYSSGGHWPAGSDTRFPRNVVYPGCLTLFRILDRAWSPNNPACNLVFLSARPHIYKHYSEEVTYGKFKQLFDEGRLHSMPTLLPGALPAGVRAILQYFWKGNRAWKQVAEKKLDMYRSYRDLYLEYDFIFFGDNGQGDLWAGEAMQEEHAESRTLPQLKAVCIQRVIDEHLSLRHPPAPDASRLREMEPEDSLEEGEGGEEFPGTHISLSPERPERCLVLHRSYVGAALALHKRDKDLISLPELCKVAESAVEEFRSMRLVYAEWGEHWRQAEKELKADLQALQKEVDDENRRSTGDHLSVPRLEETDRLLAKEKLHMQFKRSSILVPPNAGGLGQRLPTPGYPGSGLARTPSLLRRPIAEIPEGQELVGPPVGVRGVGITGPTLHFDPAQSSGS